MKKHIKYMVLFAVTLFSLNSLTAQSSINTSGGEIEGESGSVSFTVGQNVFGKTEGDEGGVNAFIQQSYGITVITDLTEEEEVNLSISSYPNPTTDLLMIEMDNIELDQINYSVFDVSGREIISGNVNNKKTQISLAQNEPGIYIVNISDKQKKIKSFQVIKN